MKCAGVKFKQTSKDASNMINWTEHRERWHFWEWTCQLAEHIGRENIL